MLRDLMFQSHEFQSLKGDPPELEKKSLQKFSITNIVERPYGTKLSNVVKEQGIEDNKKAVKIICKSFPNHENVKAIKENNIERKLTAVNSHLPKVSACDVEQLLRNIDSKKSKGKIPPKLIILSPIFLRKPFAIAINDSFNKVMLPGNAKIACVSPLNIHTDDKYSVTKFRPVSILNAFSKIMKKL